MSSTKWRHLGMSPNFADDGCSTMKVWPSAIAKYASKTTLHDITFPAFTQCNFSLPKGEYQKRSAWEQHMKLIEEQTGARIMRPFGCSRKIARIASLNAHPKKISASLGGPVNSSVSSMFQQKIDEWTVQGTQSLQVQKYYWSDHHNCSLKLCQQDPTAAWPMLH